MINLHPDWYDLFYFIAIAVSVSFLLFEGQRRKFPILTWLISLIIVLFFLIIGSKVLTLHPDQWINFIKHGELPIETGRTILGALVGCIIGLLTARYFFRIPLSAFDMLGMVLPLAMAIQRIGCFYCGCCYGSPTHVSWAVIYPQNSHAHIDQVNSGMINFSDAHTLPVHPNQLYQAAACLIIFILINFYFRFKIKRTGNLFFLSITLYLVSRVFTEFFRAPLSDGYAGEQILGLKIVQWLLLFFILIISLFIFIRERNVNTNLNKDNFLENNKIGLFSFILISLIVLTWSWLPGIERLLLSGFIFIMGIYLLIYFRQNVQILNFRFVISSLSILIIFIGGWSSADTLNSVQKDYFSIGGGGFKGDYTYIVRGCSSTTVYHYDYDLVGGKLSYTHFTKRNNSWEFIPSYSIGEQTERVSGRVSSYNIGGIGFKADFNSEKIGYTLGITYGNFVYQINKNPALPVVGFRYGNIKRWYVSASYGDQFPGISGPEPFLLELGSPFKTKNIMFRFGYTTAGIYLRPTFYLLKQRLAIESYLHVGSLDPLFTEGTSGTRIGLNTVWRFKK